MPIKAYIYAAALAILAGFGLWVNHLVKTVDDQKQLITAQSTAIDAANKSLKATNDAITASNQDSVKHQQAIEAIQNENDILRNNLSSGANIVRVKANCPKLPNTATGASGTTDAAPRLDDTAQQDYVSLTSAIKTNALAYQRCMDDNKLIRKIIGEANASY